MPRYFGRPALNFQYTLPKLEIPIFHIREIEAKLGQQVISHHITSQANIFLSNI